MIQVGHLSYFYVFTTLIVVVGEYPLLFSFSLSAYSKGYIVVTHKENSMAAWRVIEC